MADLFYSHSKADSHVVLKLLEKLRLVPYSVWFDADGGIGAGDRWKENIAQGIQECGALLLLASRNAWLTDNVAEELELAKRFNKRIIVFDSDGVAPPPAFHWLSAFHRIKVVANGDDIRELERVFPPASGDAGAPRWDSVRPPIAQLDEGARTLPWLVDRVEQKQQFETFCVNLALGDAGPPGPVVIITQGAENQLVEKFQECLALHETADWASQAGLIGTVAGARYARVEFHKVAPCSAEDLRKPHDFVAHLPQRLARRFPHPPSANIPGLRDALGAHPVLPVFSFRYRSDQAGGGAFEKFLDRFHAFWASPEWQTPDADALTLVSLAITHHPRKNRSSMVRKSVETARKRFPRFQIFLLGDLADVPFLDALDWVEISAVKKALPALGVDPDRVIERLTTFYGPNPKPKAMKDVAEVIQKAIFEP